MMTDDEMRAIAARVEADTEEEINNPDYRAVRFAQACVDRERLLAEVKRLRRQATATSPAW